MKRFEFTVEPLKEGLESIELVIEITRKERLMYAISKTISAISPKVLAISAVVGAIAIPAGAIVGTIAGEYISSSNEEGMALAIVRESVRRTLNDSTIDFSLNESGELVLRRIIPE